jgi:hypothetical protein
MWALEETYACGALESFYRLLGLSSGGRPRWKEPPPPAVVVHPVYDAVFFPSSPPIKEQLQEQLQEQGGEEIAAQEFHLKEDEGMEGEEEQEQEQDGGGGGGTEDEEEEFMDIVEKPKTRSKRRPKVPVSVGLDPVATRGEGTQPPPPPPPISPVYCNDNGSLVTHSPSPSHPASQLASCQMSDIQPEPYHMPQISLLSTTDRNLPANLTQISATGGKRVLHSTHLAGLFEFCGKIFGQWPPVRESPIPRPHTKCSRSFIS